MSLMQPNSLGYIEMQPGTLIDVNQIDRYPANKLVLITTGSQGEPMSALTRMAFSEHRSVEIVPGDTVILSSSAIPGNEKSVYRVINELYRRGANVIYESLSEIHVSGHAYQEELKLLHNLVHPRFFIQPMVSTGTCTATPNWPTSWATRGKAFLCWAMATSLNSIPLNKKQ